MITLKPEEIINRLGNAPGRKLITFREVALPNWEMPIRVRVLDKKPIPVLDEYVLRLIETGLSIASDIGNFLGISSILIEHTMADLVNGGYITPRINIRDKKSGVAYSLTMTGRKLVSDLEEIQPKTVVVNFTYDGLTHEFGLVPNEDRWRPRDVRQYGLLEIPAYPSDPPKVGPSSTKDIQSVLAQSPASERGAELMSVLGTDGKRTKFFRKAIALIFESSDSERELSIQFAVDGRRSEAHERAFSVADGLKKLGIISSVTNDSERSRILQDLSPTVQKALSDHHGGETLSKLTGRLQSSLENLESSLSSVGGENRARVQQQIDNTAIDLADATKSLESIPVRTLPVQEHPQKLQDALTNSKYRILIISPWLRTAVMDKEFLSKLESRLKEGVVVHIGFGIGNFNGQTREDEEGRDALLPLEKRFSNLVVSRLGNTHAKVLIVDHEYLIVTSFNWLSFRGDPKRPFRDERGTLITIDDEIEKIYGEYKESIELVHSTKMN